MWPQERVMTGSNTKPLVTIITSTFNSEKYIEETIKSVINQTYTNWEWIIVDDCSDDSTKDLIAKYEEKDTRIKLVSLKTNSGGPAKPRNTALMIASMIDGKSKIENLFLATGHYRNGVLFSAITSDIIFRLVQNKSLKEIEKSFLEKFSLDRFEI